MEPQKTQRALDLAAKKRIIGVAYSASSPRFGLKIETKIGTEPVLHDISVRHLSVIVRKNRAIAKDRGGPFTFMFSQYESYLKR